MWLGSEAVPSRSQKVIWTSQCYSAGIFTLTFFLSKRPEMEVYHPRTHVCTYTCFSPILPQIGFSVPFPVPFSSLKDKGNCMFLSQTSVQLGKSLGLSPVKKDRQEVWWRVSENYTVFANEPFLPSYWFGFNIDV